MKKTIVILCFLLVSAFLAYFYYIHQLDIQELRRIEAERDDVIAQTFRGLSYKHGYFGVEQNDAEAVKWFRKAAEQGYGLAQYDLGLCYAEGKGVERDYAEAVKWFRKAAEQGYGLAKEALNKIEKKSTETDDNP